MDLTAKGSSIILPHPYFNSLKSLESCYEYKGTSIYGVPTMFIELLKTQELKKFPLKSLKNGIIAGALCPESLLKRIKDILNIENLSVAYGMTETSPVSFMTRKEDSIKIKTETVGSILPHLEAKIVNSDGEVVDINNEGEFIVKGYSVMKGYYNKRR